MSTIYDDLLPTVPEYCLESFSDAATCAGMVGLYGIVLLGTSPWEYMIIHDIRVLIFISIFGGIVCFIEWLVKRIIESCKRRLSND